MTPRKCESCGQPCRRDRSLCKHCRQGCSPLCQGGVLHAADCRRPQPPEIQAETALSIAQAKILAETYGAP